MLLADGGLVISALLDRRKVARLEAELDPFVTARQPGFRHFGSEGFYGGNTKRIQGLATKSPEFVRSMLLNPVLNGIADSVLLPNCGDYWLSQAETIYIGPGSNAQELHRDDLNWSHVSRLGIETQVSTLVALGDYRDAVGATRVVPRSHLQPPGSRFDASLARPVEMEPGDALVYLGSLIHGGGENSTTDTWRRAVYMGFIVSWLTPEEAVSRSIDPEFAASLPRRARELLGWASLRGNPTTSTGAISEAHLWQLDDDDPARRSGVFIERT